MVIEYQIKRLDLIKLLYYNIRHSKRTQLVIGGALVFTYLSSLLIRYLTFGNLLLLDFGYAFIAVIFFIIGLPILLFLMAKTQKRRLSIGPNGIETVIGSTAGKISWKVVDSIENTEKYIYITGKNANAFTIPNTAFLSDELRNQFLMLASNYHNEIESPSRKK